MISNALPTILVVDDEPAILDALEDLLEDDFQVLRACGGLEALAMLEQHTVWVVLSDQKMPGMKGEEFLARVAEKHLSTRVLLTGYSDFDDLVSAVNRGHIYAFVAKPWTPHQLRSLVRAASERFGLERELRQEKKLLELLLENVPDLISIKDQQGRYLRVNAACARALGLDEPLALLGKTDQELGGPLFLEAPAHERSILEGSEPDMDLTAKAVRGPQWYSTTRVATPSAEGPPLLIGISRDITERLENNRRLEEHAQQLERLNQELSRFSFIVAHHLQEPLRRIASFTDLLLRRSMLKKGAEEYTGYISESVHRAKALMRDFSLYLDLHQSQEQAPLALAATVSASVESLASEHARVSVRVEGDALVVGRPDLIIQLFRALLDNALVHGNADKEVVVTISHRESTDRVLVTIDDQGFGIPVESRALVFQLFETLDSGARSGLGLALCQKIVELHDGEIWLESNEQDGLRVSFTLAEQGAPLPYEASQVLPRHQSPQVDPSMQRAETFAATAAHDLQEPLRMIAGYLRLLERREASALSDDGREYLRFAVDGAQRMKALIDTLLSYAISGQSPDGEELTLHEIIEQVLVDLRPAIAEQQAVVEVRPLPSVRMRAVEGRQLLANLIGNALKYRGQDSPLIIIDAEPVGESQVVTVSDNGLGIPESAAQTVFEPFVRGDQEGVAKGAGLGLATCRRIVRRWGGEIWWESRETQGTRFRFTLPRK